MQKKRLLAGALGCMLVCTHPAGLLTAAEIPQAQEIENTVQEQMNRSADTSKLPQTPEELAPDDQDPDYIKRQVWSTHMPHS